MGRGLKCSRSISVVDQILSIIDKRFRALEMRSLTRLERTTDEIVYRRPVESHSEFVPVTIGEYLLRSAAAVEQVCGGITTRLWDDPFEWTLPEKLSTVERVKEYLLEVEASRRRAFETLAGADLTKNIPAPDQLRPLLDILIHALERATHFQGRAIAIHQVLTDEKPVQFR